MTTNDTIRSRQTTKATATITVALPDIPVRPYGSDRWINLPFSDIRIVRPSDDGLLDVIFSTRRPLNSDLTADEIGSGEIDINQLLTALGWQPGMSHNKHLAHLTSDDAS